MLSVNDKAVTPVDFVSPGCADRAVLSALTRVFSSVAEARLKVTHRVFDSTLLNTDFFRHYSAQCPAMSDQGFWLQFLQNFSNVTSRKFTSAVEGVLAF